MHICSISITSTHFSLFSHFAHLITEQAVASLTVWYLLMALAFGLPPQCMHKSESAKMKEETGNELHSSHGWQYYERGELLVGQQHYHHHQTTPQAVCGQQQLWSTEGGQFEKGKQMQEKEGKAPTAKDVWWWWLLPPPQLSSSVAFLACQLKSAHLSTTIFAVFLSTNRACFRDIFHHYWLYYLKLDHTHHLLSPLGTY